MIRECKICLVCLWMIIPGIFSAQSKTDSLAQRHNEMMAIMMTQPKYPVKTIGIYVYDGFNTLDAFGPYHVLGELMGADVFFVAKQKGFVQNQRGVKIQVDKSIDVVNKLDILVIPGGASETFLQTKDTALLNWIKMIDQNSVFTTSVCTGGWILGATGLLKDKEVTCNWYRADEIMKMYGAKFIQKRYVKDGKYWTSAGVTAGMDMALGIVQELMGDKYTQGVMLDLEYDPEPPIEAGSVTNTDDLVIEMMRTMYDSGLLPMIESEKKLRLPKPTIWEAWPDLDAYHKIMSATFHPAESGDLSPLKKYASELANLATILRKANVPTEFQNPAMSETLNLLEKESISILKQVNSKKSDVLLKNSIYALHDRFHEVVERCLDKN
ncbi:MAG: DJ-1/PfpI family protein [Saprospiraceae bacterium]|nr:DJ-1/PfpI family protein [Saprospiraceae bacterium]MBK7437295.1 DJ-1/PfpI family protein [Saprospiraceae bacterium]MBK8283293.1 DJ-1/PfpI family protein [Saprospiraceae bacterium]MBK8512672.1 DJ-1/PfpI family protein [Saprospiraceae bacterium]MBK9678429.1 DJ-1/PfpI family protein [Saprospiraceae bacterium]